MKKLLLGMSFSLFLFSGYCGTPDENLLDSIKKADAKNLAQALKDGANPNLADAQGNTVLAMAATFGQTETVKVLLEKGANVNFQDQNGNTALMAACKNNRAEIVKLLVSKNPDINLKNKEGDTCLSIALGKKLKEIAQMLIKSAKDLDVDTALVIAAIKSNDEEIYKMMKAKAEASTRPEVNAKDKLDRITIDYLDFKDTPITKVVIALNEFIKKSDRENTGIKVILPLPSCQAKELTIPNVTATLKTVSLGKALDEICNASGMTYQTEKNLIVMSFTEKNYVVDGNYKSELEKIKKIWGDFNIQAFKQNNKYGFVDITNGKIIAKAQFDKTRWFCDGQCPVLVDKKWGIIDKAGSFVIKPQFDDIPGLLFAGKWAVKIDKKLGFIDKSGKIVIEPKFDDIKSFSDSEEDPIAVKLDNKWGFIDKDIKMIIEPQFDDVDWSPFRNGASLGAVKIDKKWGYIDRSGKIVIEPQFEQASRFTADLAPVKIDKKWGYIDKTGKIVIKPQFDEARSFYGKTLAAVSINKKWGYIDRYGKMIIEPQLERAFGFDMDGLASVKVGKNGGYIDMTGQFIIAPQFDQAWEFFEGAAIVKLGDRYFKIDRTGKIITPIYFIK